MQQHSHYKTRSVTDTHTHYRPFVQDYPGEPVPEGKTNLDFTEARDSEWQWHQLDHMQVCTSLRANNHASTPPLSFLQAGCPSCCPTNSVKALKANGSRLGIKIFASVKVSYCLLVMCSVRRAERAATG